MTQYGGILFSVMGRGRAHLGPQGTPNKPRVGGGLGQGVGVRGRCWGEGSGDGSAGLRDAPSQRRNHHLRQDSQGTLLRVIESMFIQSRALFEKVFSKRTE